MATCSFSHVFFSGSDTDTSTERKARAAFSNPLFTRHHPRRGRGRISTDGAGPSSANFSVASPDRMLSEDIATALAEATASVCHPHDSYDGRGGDDNDGRFNVRNWQEADASNGASLPRMVFGHKRNIGTKAEAQTRRRREGELQQPQEVEEKQQQRQQRDSPAEFAGGYGVSPTDGVPTGLAMGLTASPYLGSKPPLLPDRSRAGSPRRSPLGGASLNPRWVSNSTDGPVLQSPSSRPDTTRSGWHNWALSSSQSAWKLPSPLGEGEHAVLHNRRRKSLPQSMAQRMSSSFTNTNSTGNYSSGDSVGSWDFEREESAPRPIRSSSSRRSRSAFGGRGMRKSLSTKSLPNRQDQRRGREASLPEERNQQKQKQKQKHKQKQKQKQQQQEQPRRRRFSENEVNMARSLRRAFPDSESLPTSTGAPAWLEAPAGASTITPRRRESVSVGHRRTSSAAASPAAGSSGGSTFGSYPTGSGINSEIRLAQRLSGGAWDRVHPQQFAGLPTSGRSFSGTSSEAGPDSAVELLAGVVEMLREQVGKDFCFALSLFLFFCLVLVSIMFRLLVRR